MEHAVENIGTIAPHVMEELRKNIKKLGSVEQVYLSEGPGKGMIMTILINGNCQMPVLKNSSEIRKILECLPQLQYRIYTLTYAQEELEKGNLYFLRNCRLGKMVYRRSNLQSPNSLTIEDVELLLKKATSDLEREIERINSFTEGIKFYRKRKEWAGAAFLIHQKIEWLYRCLETFAIGKPLICHKIKNHLDYAHPFVYGAGPIINTKRRIELHLLEILDRAYIESRYHSTFDVTKREIKVLNERAEIMEQQVREIFSFRFGDCQKLLSEEKENRKIDTEAEEKTSLGKGETDFELLKEIILEELPAIKIISFGKRTGFQKREGLAEDSEVHSHSHHDLLILTKDTAKINPNKISHLISEKTDGKLATTIIFTSLKKARQALSTRNIFHNQVLKKGKQIFSDPKFSIDVPEAVICTKDDLQKIIRDFSVRQSRAHGFLRATSEVEVDDDATEISLQHMALQQISLGAIYVILGLRPNFIRLEYLFDLCSNFSNAPNDCFPRRSKEDQRLFKKLTSSFHGIRFRTSDSRSLVDVDILFSRSQHFLNEMESLVEKRVEELEMDFKKVMT